MEWLHRKRKAEQEWQSKVICELASMRKSIEKQHIDFSTLLEKQQIIDRKISVLWKKQGSLLELLKISLSAAYNIDPDIINAIDSFFEGSEGELLCQAEEFDEDYKSMGQEIDELMQMVDELAMKVGILPKQQ